MGGVFAAGAALQDVHIVADVECSGAKGAKGLRGVCGEVMMTAGAFERGDLRHLCMLPSRRGGAKRHGILLGED